MERALIVVHRLAASGGRRVSVHRGGRAEILGLAHSDHDLIAFLEAAGLSSPAELLDNPGWVEWRGGRPHEWGSAP
ncbi:hypothetical protein J8N05_24980 [Streptomyces sp. BH-SS-21]|uniref:Uncharacterized protein n=1 Tax=Streptomyces liliiviolaceus TaxID=2823109 RepID=A0A941B5H1_9ACTN|nr:hypothetical protein [Streptomyces liliiviolaceus]MBQ0851425.1 hypothetical protein [Streptomyces liliiviolaceus]